MSYLRKILGSQENGKNVKNLIFYGLQGHKVSQEDVELISHLNPKMSFYRNKEGISSILPKKAQGEFSATCFDLSAMKAEFAPGVSEPNPVMGFSKQEILSTLSCL